MGGGHFTIFTSLTEEITLSLSVTVESPLYISLCFREQSRYMLDTHVTPQLCSYFSTDKTFLYIYIYVALDKCSPRELSEINFIWSLITEHVLWCISHAPPPETATSPSPAHPQYCHFQSYFKAMCDYLWHCLTCAWRLSLSSLSLLSPSVSPCLSFCLSLIKKPNHADGSEQITSHSLWMFEDDGATGATREEMHSDRSRSWSQRDIISFLLF